jgi:hypothetical protein
MQDAWQASTEIIPPSDNASQPRPIKRTLGASSPLARAPFPQYNHDDSGPIYIAVPPKPHALTHTRMV